jgi:hypothetical protein
MSGDPDPDILPLAASISTGAPLDWEEIEREASVDTEDILPQLKVIEEIARFHRWAVARVAGNDATTQDPDLASWSHFSIHEQLGAGGFGAVYRATDTKVGREVALKLLAPSTAANIVDPSQLLKEANLLSRAEHTNVVTVYGADHVEGRVGIWMELVRGRTLEGLLQSQGLFSAREAAAIGLDLCRALSAVHRVGLVHGDVKTHNVMREEGGRIVLMDFGAGKDSRATPFQRSAADDFAGTPLYLAPEVFAGQPRTRSSDLYSLGTLLFHLVTGEYPVGGRTRADIQLGHQQGHRTYLRDLRPEISDEFTRVVERALEPDPRNRFQSAGAFEADLARLLGFVPKQPATARWKRLSLVAATVLGIAALGIAWVLGRSEPAVPEPTLPNTLPMRADAEPTYRVRASLLRIGADAKEELMTSGAEVRPGERLGLDIRTTIATYVYVVTEDDRGESYLLFPLPGQRPDNPLQAGQTHRLPGERNGEPFYWQVTSPGGREHFLIFAAPEPLAAFERLFESLPTPTLNAPVTNAPLSLDSVGALRGVGGLASQPPDTNAPARLVDQFTVPLPGGEEVANGVWIRKITLENPLR